MTASLVLHPTAEADANLVSHLRELLARAEAGEMRGICYAAVYRDRTTRQGKSGERTASVLMLGSIAVLQQWIAREIEQESGYSDGAA